jgi:hypothetical protein
MLVRHIECIQNQGVEGIAISINAPFRSFYGDVNSSTLSTAGLSHESNDIVKNMKEH